MSHDDLPRDYGLRRGMYRCCVHGLFRVTRFDRSPSVSAPCWRCGQPAGYTGEFTSAPLSASNVLAAAARDLAAGTGWSWKRPRAAPVEDPLDVKIDRVTLRDLLLADEARRREMTRGYIRMTEAQRGAIAAHWSAQLRAKVAEGRDRDRRRVVVDQEDD